MGDGLVEMERMAHEVSRICPTQIQVVGFDTGTGIPEHVDYRDLPYIWRKGHYRMNVDTVRRRLKNAELVLGDVTDTVPAFLSQLKNAAIGFVAFDLDFYSSSCAALRIFGGPDELYLPRVLSTSMMLSAPTGSCIAKTSENCWLLKNSTVHLRWRTASVQSTGWLPNGVWHPPGHPTCWCATGTTIAAIATISASTRVISSHRIRKTTCSCLAARSGTGPESSAEGNKSVSDARGNTERNCWRRVCRVLTKPLRV